MRFYSMSYFDVLKLSIKVFIQLYDNINIVRAEENINDVTRNSTLLGGGSEYIQQCKDILEKGISVEEEPSLDREGFKQMKTLFSK